LEKDNDNDIDKDGGQEAVTDRLLEATTAALPPILSGLDALSFAGRHLHPPNIESVAAAIHEYQEPIDLGLASFADAPWPEHLQDFQQQVTQAGTMASKGLAAFAAAAEADNPTMQGYRALGYLPRGLELLYPLTAMLPPVNRFFLNPANRDNVSLLESLQPDQARDDVGVFHFNNAATERAGFSLYVPENYDPNQQYPLVFALHGGSGHGRTFLWSWLADARSQGALLISPTSSEGTWSLMNPEVDVPNLHKMLAHVQAHWSVDSERVLLSGMSDGGTFSYLAGLTDDSPFTHIAPTSASFHPMLLSGCSPERLQGLPLYLTHGALDWMFDVEMARTAAQALTQAGVALEYRELNDLSHTFPKDENERVLDWLKSG